VVVDGSKPTPGSSASDLDARPAVVYSMSGEIMQARAAFKWIWTSGWTGAMSLYGLSFQLVRRDIALFQRHTRFWAENVARGIGMTVETHGAGKLDPNGCYVLMANHQSHADIVALFLALPMVPGFLAKAELKRIPIFGRAMQAGGHVFVDRKKHGQAVSAISAAAAEVRNGGSIVIFPEGTRSSQREVLPFKKGGFHLAKEAGVPLVPIGIRGTAAILAKHSREIRSGHCEVHIGDPIAVDRVRALSLAELMSEVRGSITALSALPAAKDRTVS
jgi:1-acyl-sn-glycerol-3-phosphate acyltransferase